MNLHRPVRIGDFTTSGNLFLAPVAGYSDAAYRSVCHDAGCDLAYTEMVSSEALIRESEKTAILLERAENETRYAVQLFGANPEVMAKAASLVEQRWQPALIDVNCGCPVPKIIRTGAGSALMRDIPRLQAIVSAMRSAVTVPVTVKIRLGWDASSINYLEVAQAAVEAGAQAVTLHARTRHQGYTGTADRSAFFKLAARLEVPVFVSGDMFSPEAALAVLQPPASSADAGGWHGAVSGQPEEGAGKASPDTAFIRLPAGLMLARGAMGNPFLFTRVRAALRGEPEPVISSMQKLQFARRHFFLSLRFYSEHTACVEFRKQACSYLKGIPHGAELRNMAVHCSDPAEYEEFFTAWEQAAAN